MAFKASTRKKIQIDKPSNGDPKRYRVPNQSRTNSPINAHLTIAQVMPRYNHNNEKQEALL